MAVSAAAVLDLSYLSAHAVERAGGGHSSGGGSGVSSGGGSTGAGYHHFYGTGTGIGGGGIVFVLFLAVFGLRFFRGRRRTGAVIPLQPNRWVAPDQGWHSQLPSEPQLDGGVAAILAHDPAFDETAFLADAQRTFFIVEQAWSERKPELARAVMADVLWQQHKAQIDGYKSAGKTNVLEDLTVSNMTVIDAGSDVSWDTIIVRVDAACADYDRDDRTGEIVRGDNQVTPWQENWTFQRPSKSVTSAPPLGSTGHCQSCGAPLDDNLGGTCRFCGTAVTGNPTGWKLVRITQVTGS